MILTEQNMRDYDKQLKESVLTESKVLVDLEVELSNIENFNTTTYDSVPIFKAIKKVCGVDVSKIYKSATASKRNGIRFDAIDDNYGYFIYAIDFESKSISVDGNRNSSAQERDWKGAIKRTSNFNNVTDQFIKNLGF